MSSLWARPLYTTGEPSFNGLFRLLEDFDNYSRDVAPRSARRGQQATQWFNPRFDVRETENSFELHGELAGIEKDNVNIEFTEPQTMVVKGRIERSYSSGTATPVAEEEHDTVVSDKESHKATVTDEAEESATQKGKEVEKAEKKEVGRPAPPRERYWHQERTVGSFQRTFQFPTRVDETGVKAKIENGILHVTVPKAPKHESRRITIV